MKIKAIIGGLFAVTGTANAQWNYGFGDRDVASLMPNGGVQITKSSPYTGHATLFLDNQLTGGHRYSFSSIGPLTGLTAGDLSFYDWSTNTEVMHVLGSNANIGFGTSNPTEQIHSTAGVRFQGLVTGGNPTHFVTIDANGKLWRNSLIGNYCNQTPNPLASDYVVPLGTNRYLFSGQSLLNITAQQDVVAVGYNCNTVLPLAKFSVLQNQNNTANTVTYAGYFENNDNATVSLFNLTGGVHGRSYKSKGTNDATNVGGVFEAHDSRRSIGVLGRLSQTSLYPGFDIGVGGMFIADTIAGTGSTFGSRNFGVYARAAVGSINYALYAEVAGSNAAITPGGPIPPTGNFAGYFVGDVVRTGNDNFLSDRRFKENINNISDALTIINKIEAKTYTYKNSEYSHMALPQGKQFGVIAQQLLEVLPEVVNPAFHPEKFDKQGQKISERIDYLTVEYQQFIPLLIKSVQELSQKNRQLDSLVNYLAKRLSEASSPTGSKANFEKNGEKVIVLNQNTPNPFAESTSISFSIPVDFTKAQIVFTTNEGKVIKSVEITSKGQGNITVFANDLSKGIYSYCLIVDGNIMASKRMVVTDKQ